MARSWLVVLLGAACTTSGDRSVSAGQSDADDSGGATTDVSSSAATDAGAEPSTTGTTTGGCDTDGCAPASCNETACSGHGRCTELPAGIACECDEGFTGEACDAIGPDHHARTLLVPGLADPDVLAHHDDAFLLTGTKSTRTVPLFASADLLAWEELPEYDPSAADPAHDYCHVWAPDLSHDEGGVRLYFSAHRVAKGAPCPPPTGQTVTTFVVASPDLELDFGVPSLVELGANAPASRVETGCPAAGCSHAIRIDAAFHVDGDERWFFWVWFEGGNNIASVRLDAPADVIRHAGPAVFPTAAYEESINEGPDIFTRDGRHHLFFSTGFFDSQYAMFHIVADDIAELTRARNVRRHSMPLRDSSGRLVESHGHNSLVTRRGEVFNVFHQGEFDGAGQLVGRSTYKQRIAFRSDGSIVALNYADVRWSEIDGARYSLDVVTQDGDVVGPCIGEDVIGTSTSVRFTEICPNAADTLVRKSEIAALRVYWSSDGQWDDFVEVDYDAADDRVFVPVPGGRTSAVALRWNELQTLAEYSLDVQLDDGTWIAPCVGAPVLGTAIDTVFAGTCTSTATEVAIADVQAFRVCSAQGGDWANATCGTAAYDGEAGFVDVAIPE